METALTWGRDHLAVIIAIVAAVLALIGAILSRAETRKQRRILHENLRHTVDTQSLAWGNQAIALLGQAAMFARTRKHQANDAAFLQQRINLMLALSTTVERGRLFFPNIDPDKKGTEKEGVYRGARPPILDALMFAYYEIDALTRTSGPTADNSADYIDDCRRLLVSELQAHLDPKRRGAIAGRYDNQRSSHRAEARERAKTLETLLKSRRPGINLGERSETVQ